MLNAALENAFAAGLEVSVVLDEGYFVHPPKAPSIEVQSIKRVL